MSKELVKQKVIQLSKSFDSAFEPEEYKDQFSICVRDWGIPKEYEDQIRQEDRVQSILEKHRLRLANLVGDNPQVRKVDIQLQDKNYLDLIVYWK